MSKFEKGESSGTTGSSRVVNDQEITTASGDGGYECKTCSKMFNSYQALGGHQGIHRKPQVDDQKLNEHRCKICRKVFESGPALGGHMTRHRKGKDVVVQDMSEDQVRKNELILAAKEWRLWPDK